MRLTDWCRHSKGARHLGLFQDHCLDPVIWAAITTGSARRANFQRSHPSGGGVGDKTFARGIRQLASRRTPMIQEHVSTKMSFLHEAIPYHRLNSLPREEGPTKIKGRSLRDSLDISFRTEQGNFIYS